VSRTVAPGTKSITVPRPRPKQDALASFYCGGWAGLLKPKLVKAQEPPAQQPPVQQPPVQQPPAQQPPAQQPPVVPPQPQPPLPQIQPQPQPQPQPVPLPAQAVPSTPLPPGGIPSASHPALLPMAIDSIAMFKGAAQAATTQLTESRESLDSLSVEIQKKFALSFACLVFVLFGPPIALRFPRGGVGVTIGVSIIVFGLYYICLMGGEALADKGQLPAIVAMWIANAIFGAVGVLLLWRVESTTDTSRGGGVRDWWADRKARASLRALERAEAAAKSSATARA
jgi:lipopolysaccharide export system permease protein